VWMCGIIRVIFVGGCVNQSLSQQVTMDEIAKNMITSAHSAERNQKCSVIFTRENCNRVYI
jgi:hypothetical protein